MNRRSFLSMLGLGTAGVAAMPLVKKSYFFLDGLWRPDFELNCGLNGVISFPEEIVRVTNYNGEAYVFTKSSIFKLVPNRHRHSLPQFEATEITQPIFEQAAMAMSMGFVVVPA